MTQPPYVPGTTPPTGDWKPPAPKSRALPWLLAALVVSILVVAGLLLALARGPEEPKSEPPVAALTEATAQRACRTAFGREWEERSSQADKAGDGVISTVREIRLLETWKTTTGYGVNGTVHYTLSAGIIDPIEDTIDLTCAVTGTDEAPVTAVNNRN